MSFFVPHLPDREDSELLWDHVREQLADRGHPTTWRRIRALVSDDGGVTSLAVAVGGDTYLAEDDPVMLILEASDQDRVVYICTLSQVAKGKPPCRCKLSEGSRVIDFSERAGQA